MWEAIREIAAAEQSPVTLRHMCLACESTVRAGSVGLYLASEFELPDPLFATSPFSEKILELHATLGEGPSAAAFEQDWPILVSDISDPAYERRWPAFCTEAAGLGLVSIFTFPLALGAITVGALEIHSDRRQSLHGAQLAEARTFAEAALVLVCDYLAGISSVAGDDFSSRLVEIRWAEVHQATGMIAAQLDIALDEAFLRLRAHSYATGRSLIDVSGDIINDRLRLTLDGGS
ncbi:ANTAR domain-containing protein [Pseudonocardiaceae bacterium YIM PH 21723]|nr:ANTAR domain-containing protein [Pseudonocardiaceae bacterium YIM PH 21723]